MKNIYILSAVAEPAADLIRAWAIDRGENLCRDVEPADLGSLTELNKEDLLVIASPADEEIIGKDLLEKILLHVLDGGRILFAGAGTRIRKPYELALMMGARWQESLPYTQQTMRFYPGTDRECTREIWEELWLFERSVFDDATVLADITIGTVSYPVIWERNWYNGKVYCLALSLTDPDQPGYKEALEEILRSAAGGE